MFLHVLSYIQSRNSLLNDKWSAYYYFIHNITRLFLYTWNLNIRVVKKGYIMDVDEHETIQLYTWTQIKVKE